MSTSTTVAEDPRTALVTGATSGIGRAIAEALAAAGAEPTGFDPVPTAP